MKEELFKGIIRNISRLIILWTVGHEAHSGYEILKEMRRTTGQNLHPGVVYPLLYELEEGKYIDGTKVQKGRRLMTYYLITDKGSKLLTNFKELSKLPLGSMLQELIGK